MRRLGPRPRTLGHLAGAALVVSLLGGCGSDAPSATEPDPSTTTVSAPPTSPTSPTSPAAPTSAASVAADQVAILSATAAGGQVGTGAVALTDDAAVQGFASQFETRVLADRVTRVAARTDVPVGRTLYAAVVAVGCDVPPGVVVTSTDEGVMITAEPAKAATVECFAPVTSVALVLVTDQ